VLFRSGPPTEEDWLVASDVVNSDKIKWTIEGYGSLKHAGKDGILPVLLKNGIEILSDHWLKSSSLFLL
jgi:hypothetical protein